MVRLDSGTYTQADSWISGWSPTAKETETEGWLLSVMPGHRLLLERPGKE
jgi:hypothetical protein